MHLRIATGTKLCDTCASQEDRHYCLLHSQQVKNMDILVCDDWTNKSLLCMTVEMDNGPMPLEKALARMTDEWIDAGQDSSQTTFDMRDALRCAVALVKELERQIEALEGANADE